MTEPSRRETTTGCATDEAQLQRRASTLCALGERCLPARCNPSPKEEDFMNRSRTTTRLWTFLASRMLALVLAGPLLVSLVAGTMTFGVGLATPAWADPLFFSTGTPDGLLGALSEPPSSGTLETETADDFILTETTSIARATITGLIPSGTPVADIRNVEVEVYHVFPKDSADPPSGRVPLRVNSPADVEIDTATRDGSLGTLAFTASLLNPSFSVLNIVVTGGNFLSLSAPKPIVPPGTPFLGDLQAWIRNSDLAPDWLRIGTDIIDGTPARTFNIAFSLTGETIPHAGTPGQASCHGKSVSALAHQFRGLDAAASALGFSSVEALQDAFKTFCER